MKPRSSVISVVACLIILFACFTQIGATAYIGNVSPTLDRSSRYESSYVVERFNSTHYQATNGTSGAVGTPSTSFASVMNSAIASGDSILIKDGVYTVDSAIVDGNNNNVEITMSSGTVLRLANGANTNVFALTSVFGWYIHGGEIDGNKAGQTVGNDFAISLENVDNSTIEGVYVYGAYNAAGISINTGSANNYVRDCRIKNNGGDGVRVWNSNGTTISSCTLEGNTLDGVQFRNSSHSVVEGNIIRLNLDAGVSFCDGSHYNLAEANTLYHNVLVDLECTNTPGAQSQHNKMTGNIVNSIGTSYGVKFSTSTYNTADSNQITGAKIGIYVTSANWSDVKNNRVWENDRDGIKIEKSCYCNVIANTCFDNSNSVSYGDGIAIYDGGTGVATIRNLFEANKCFDNQAVKTQDYGIQEAGTGCFSNTIQSNDVYGNKNGAIGIVGNSTVRFNAGFVSPSDGSAFSYTVSKVGSNYYAVNGSSGLVEFGPTTNASYIIEKAGEKQNVTVFVKIGKYYINTSPIIRKSWVYFQGEGYGSEFIFTGANTGFRIESSTYEIRNVEFHDLNFNGQGIAKYAINTTAIGDSNRSRLITVSGCRFSGFYVAGASAIGLRNPELCTIEKCQFNYAAPNEGQISITSKSYYSGNIWILNNFFYIGSDYSQGGFGVYIETLDSVSHKDFVTLWSQNNQYYSDSHHNGTAIWCNPSQGGIRYVKSIGDVTERANIFYAQASNYGVTDCLIEGASVFQECAGHKLIYLGINSSRNMVRNCVLNSNNATGGIYWDDDMIDATWGKENSFIGNQKKGVGGFESGKYTRVKDNVGINPFAKKTTNFLVGSYLTAFGTSTAFAYNYQYFMRTNDCYITLTGGTSVNLTIYDQDGNVVWANCTSLTFLRIPYGYSIRLWYRTAITGVEFYWQ